MTPRQLQRDFARLLGVSISEYAAAVRASGFRRAVREDRVAVADAAYEAGYASSARLYERSNETLGMTPGRYARGGAGERLRVRLDRTDLGWVLLAATEAGICALRLGDDPAALREALRAEYPAAEVRDDEGELEPWVRLVAAFLERRALALELPLDVAGTAFQLRVWETLRRIPRGETRTYGEIARDLGLEGGARAVASACARNPVALAVPCHRVIGAGGVGGYRWGVERKRALLAIEREAAAAT